MAPQTSRPNHASGPRFQPPPRARARVILSKTARQNLRIAQCDKYAHFRKDLDTAWQKLEDMTKSLSATHGKSIRRVENELHIGHSKLRGRKTKLNAWNAFCWKKRREVMTSDSENVVSKKRDTLPLLVKDHHGDYASLTDTDKQHLLAEFAEFKETKEVGVRVSAKSKNNDVTRTLQAVENELHKLRSRTGVETLLFSTRGITNLSMRGISFATEGVDNFIGGVMGIDTQDFLNKMEGFAVQGIKGAAQNHQARVSEVRAKVRDVMIKGLQEITNDPKARMQWKYYFKNVVSRYKVVVEGWPSEVPFANLSDVSSPLAQLEMLHRKWEMGQSHWKRITEDEYKQLCEEHRTQVERGEITEPTRRSRRKRAADDQGDNSARRTKKHKSAAIVPDDDDEQHPIAPTSTNTAAASTGTPSTSDSTDPPTASTSTSTGTNSPTASASMASTSISTNPATASVNTASSTSTGTNTATADAAAALASTAPTKPNPGSEVQTALQRLSEAELNTLSQAFAEGIDDFDFGSIEESFLGV